MSESLTSDQVFIRKLTEIILANLNNENFGVRELAHNSGISRSTLNRRLRKISDKSINQFIREVRLQKALEMLQNETENASEVSYKVGFSSPAYFNKCFHDFFGYPPGKVRKVKMNGTEDSIITPSNVTQGQKKPPWQFHVFAGRGVIILAALIVIIVVLFYPKIFKKNTLDDLRAPDGKISVAVMPFKNLTNDTTWNIWQDGIQTVLISSLSNSDGLKVRQSEYVSSLLEDIGITDYASITPAVAGAISRKLEANVFILGNLINAGSLLRLNVQLVNTRTTEIFKSIEKDAAESNIMSVLDTLSQEVKDFLLISEMKKDLKYSGLDLFTTTKSAEAFRDLYDGERAWQKEDWSSAIKFFLKAIEIDSNLYQAYSLISSSYLYLGSGEEAKKWCIRMYSKLDIMTREDQVVANMYYDLFFKPDYERSKYIRQLIEFDDQDPSNYYKLGNCYMERFLYAKAVPEYEKALEIYEKKWKTKPFWVYNYTKLGIAYHKTGLYRKEKKLYKKAERNFPESPQLMSAQAILALSEGDTATANRYIDELISVRRSRSEQEANISDNLALIYSEAGFPDKAEEYYRQALSLEPGNWMRINNLASFLIEKDRNTNEALELLARALKLNAGRSDLYHWQGWGLYKQGKNEEALISLLKADSLKITFDQTLYLHLGEVKKAVAAKELGFKP